MVTTAVRGGGYRALRWLATKLPGHDEHQLGHLRAWIPISLAGIAIAMSGTLLTALLRVMGPPPPNQAGGPRRRARTVRPGAHGSPG